MMGTDRQTDGQTQVTTITLRPKRPRVKKHEFPNAGQLQWLDYMIRYQFNDPIYGHQGDMLLWVNVRKCPWGCSMVCSSVCTSSNFISDTTQDSNYNSLQWRHNGRDSVSNHQSHDCLLDSLFRRRSKKTSKLRVTGLCAGNSPVTGEFPAQRASNAENASIWWRHHVRPGNV